MRAVAREACEPPMQRLAKATRDTGVGQLKVGFGNGRNAEFLYTWEEVFS